MRLKRMRYNVGGGELPQACFNIVQQFFFLQMLDGLDILSNNIPRS